MLVQIAEGNRPELVIFFVDLNMDAIGFAASAQSDNFGKRRRLVNLFLDAGSRERRRGSSASSRRRSSLREFGSDRWGGYLGATAAGTGGEFLGENRVN